jgi:hypothetical protein
MNANVTAVVLLAVVLGALGYHYHLTTKENKRLREDVKGLNDALIATIDTSRNKYNQIKAQTETIVLSESTSRKMLKGEIQTIREGFGDRLAGIENYTKTAVRYATPIIVKSRDTVIINKVEKVYTIDQTQFGGMLYTKNDSLLGRIFFKDTIQIVVSKGKRNKWWKLWEKRPLVTNAYMSNPNGSITSHKSVLVK